MGLTDSDPPHPPLLSGPVLDEQNAHTEATKLPSPLEFRKDSEEENRDSEKDEDTKELDAVTCEPSPPSRRPGLLRPRRTRYVSGRSCRRVSFGSESAGWEKTRGACQGGPLVAMSQSAADAQTRSSWKKNEAGDANEVSGRK